MRKYVFILFLSAVSITASAQKNKEKGKEKGKEGTENAVDYSENVATIDSTIKSFYEVLTGKLKKEKKQKDQEGKKGPNGEGGPKDGKEPRAPREPKELKEVKEVAVDSSEQKATEKKEERERDWKLFAYLFHPDAKLITAGKNNDREFLVKYMSAADYVKSAGKWMDKNEFVEKEISRKSEVFGKMAHVFSTYECYDAENKEEPSMRGINSIQLLNDGERWWILNIYWTKESWFNPIPSEYVD